MDYFHLHYLLQPEQEDAFVTACVMRTFHNYVISSRSDALLDVLIFSTEEKDIRGMKALLEGMGCDCVVDTLYDEATLLAMYNPQSPIYIDQLCIYPAQAPTEHEGLLLHVPAGPAFGDGRHPTTQMLARHLLTMRFDDKRVLDLGCGTGVLGLIAQKRGATQVDFTDIDQDAVRFTAEVCAANGYPQAKVWVSDLIDDCPDTYEVLIANIYADLLLDLLEDPELQRLIPHGLVLLSGISFKRIDEVLAAVASAGFEVLAQEEQAWWHCLVIQR